MDPEKRGIGIPTEDTLTLSVSLILLSRSSGLNAQGLETNPTHENQLYMKTGRVSWLVI